ncbi:DUF4129 domain-containing protein [Blastopirellula retiformator]|uniref:Translation initiation factor IF-2 n=1 Tax=Blastopirellula retiformator TaxID=2527970 RepID=A0A5C5UTG6_9BACT|nr:DUF4129 domain-containing protein [Blastopirellula retiformator]TWT29714.1 translation initiation factor IF-2 [Blastopirellula retiformator]
MSKRQTELDYAVIAINPALIMLLVGSLVLFLLELFYGGPYIGRLQFILGDFVFASVLLARLTIEEGFEKSGRLGGIFAFVMLLALWRFVPDAVWLGLILLLVIWWCANRLTYDCTLVDDSRDTSQKGLMQWIGADFDSLGGEEKAEQNPVATATESPEAEPEKKRNWLWDVLDPTSTRFAPGVWIIYFSMAALPLFGLGQAFEPSGDSSLRWRLFLYLFTYVASALGLLMSTSFLSLRRYLGKRNMEMPTSMAGVWLGTGAVLIAVVMLVTAILPRPHAEYEVARIPGVGDLLKRSSSQYAVGKEGTQDDKNKGTTESNDKQQAGEKQQEAGDGDQGEKSQTQTKPGDGEKQSSQGKKSDQGKSGDKKSDKNKSQSGNQKNDNSSQKQDSQNSQQKTEQKSDDGKSQDQQQSDSQKSDSQQPNSQQSDSQDSDNENKSEQQNSDNQSSQEQSPQNNAPKPSSSSSFNPLQLLGSLGYLVKLLIYAAVAIAALYFAWKYRAQIAESWAKFVDDMRKLWDLLFGRRSQPTLATVEAAPVATRAPRFPEFASPFGSAAKKRTAEQLIRYTFQALEAWGDDKGVPRDHDQTPEEYGRRLAVEFSDTEIGPLARELARHYDEIAYGSGKADRDSIDCAQRLWRNLRTAY